MAKVIAPGPAGLKFWRSRQEQPSEIESGALAADAAVVSGSGTVATPIVGSGDTVDTFNPEDKHAGIILSNNNLTIAPATEGEFSIARSRGSYASGKYYFEYRKDTGDDISFGLATTLTPLDSQLGTTIGANWSAGHEYLGDVWQNDEFPAISTGKSWPDDGSWGAIAVDFDAGKAWVRNSAGWHGDPEAGTGNAITFTPGLRLFAAGSLYRDSDGGITANFGATAFQFAVPAGFSRWTGQTASISGVGTVSSAEATGTGAIAAGASVVNGAGFSASGAAGALAAQSATAAGVGVSVSSGSGALTAQDAAASGAGAVASTGTGALAAQASTATGAGLSAATGTGILLAAEATIVGDGASDSIGTGSIAAGSAEVAGAGTIAAGNSGELVAEAATVAGLGVSESIGSGALQTGAATVVGGGIGESFGTGTLVDGPATVTGEGAVLEEGATLGTGALVSGAATLAGEGEVTGEVIEPPVSAAIGGHWRPEPHKPPPVEGVGYAILPEVEGEAHGVVLVAGAGAVPAPRIVGVGTGSAGAVGHSASTLPTVKAAATGDRGQVGAARAVLKAAAASGKGVAGAYGIGAGTIRIKGSALGRHDDDEAAIMAVLLAA